MMVAADPMATKKTLKIKFGSKSIALEFGPMNNNDGNNKSVTQIGQHQSDVNKPGKRVFAVDHSRGIPSMPIGKKRAASELNEDLWKRNQKMDRSMLTQCSVLLKTLMKHRFGWVFNQPVDPIKLNIPDYFSVISEPMDLGTIKSKLDENKYVDLDQFASDIKLTFSNAVTYNPPHSEVHKMAESLQKVFDVKWKSIEDKLDPKRYKDGTGKVLNGEVMKHNAIPLKSPGTPQLPKSSLPKSSMPKSSLPKSSLSKSSLPKRPKATEEKATRVSFDARSAVVKIKATGLSATQMSKSSDPDSDGARSSVDDENRCPRSKSTISVTDEASEEDWRATKFDVPVSPKKALRAALLKQRFSDTILKAQQKTLLDHNKKADPVKLQQEKEKLERRHREEKARIEAEIKAAKAMSQVTAAYELKRQWAEERRAARIARDKMEKTVELDQNLDAQKELEMLGGIMRAYREGGRQKHPLEQFGLFIKSDWLLYDDEEEPTSTLNGDEEEGEIF